MRVSDVIYNVTKQNKTWTSWRQGTKLRVRLSLANARFASFLSKVMYIIKRKFKCLSWIWLLFHLVKWKKCIFHSCLRHEWNIHFFTSLDEIKVIFTPNIWISSIVCSLYFNSCYLELLLSQTENSSPLEFEIMRVHCICFSLDGDIVSNLRAVDIAVIPNSQCQYYMNSGDIFSSTMCAGYTHGGKDTCQVLYPLHGFRSHFGSFNPTHPLDPSKKKKKKKKKNK